VVTALLAAGDEAAAGAVNGKDEEGWAPIHSVASSGNAKIVEILLDHGMIPCCLCCRLLQYFGEIGVG
jgi:26S proteasome non-ATPase regulatory subunit 10